MAKPSRSSRRKHGISRLEAEDGRELSLGREPVAENLLFAIGRGADAGEGRGVELPALFEVANSQPGGARGLDGDLAGDFVFQAGAAAQQVLDFVSRVDDRAFP